MKSPLNAIFRPRAVAVIGASRRSGSIGREILNNLVAGDFQGKVFPVNPNAEVVHSMKCYRSVLEIPDPIDLAVIAVPATEVEAVVDECGRKGIQGLVVITAGFAETGERGRGEEAQLRELCNDHGMRMIGPNCMGVINTDPRHRLNATFSPGRPLAGKVAFLSQSGALGVAILNVARRIGLGVSMFASIGNKADVTAGDLLEYWADDRRTDLILMYLESLGDPAAFTRRARDLSRKKPIVIVKSGRTSAGARAAAGHTGALAGREAFIEALCEQCGLIRVDSIEELFDVGKAIATQPLPAGDRVAVVTNAGGPGIMATDALIAHELEIAPLSEKTREVLRAGLPAAASIINPVDMLADAGVKEYGLTLSAVLQDPGVDAAVVIFVPPIMADPIRVSRRIFREARSLRKPVIGCFMAEEEVLESVLALKENQVPIYRFPEGTALVLSALRRRQRWLERPPGVEVEIKARAADARAIVEEAASRGESWMPAADAFRLLDCYGIPTAPPHPITTSGAVPAGLEFPVVLKASGEGIVHKTEIGAVRSGIDSAEELESARSEMRSVLAEHGIDPGGVRFLAQRQVPQGREVIFGLRTDVTFSPLLIFGLGGIHVEVLKDVACRNHPITDQDAREMVRSLRGQAILDGVRGDPPADYALLESILLRLNRLTGDLTELIESLEVNPFIVHETGGAAVDCRVRLRRRS